MNRAAVILIGPPAGGKGTTAGALSTYYGFPIISPGNIYKRIREEDSELGRLVKDALKDGGICPNDLTNRIVSEEAARLDPEGNGVILDGYPRSTEQLDYLMANFNIGAWVHIESNFDVMLKAAVNRRNCKTCGVVFSVEDPMRVLGKECPRPPRNPNIIAMDCTTPCARESGDYWEQRWDDTEEMFTKRYSTQIGLLPPILERVEGLANYFRFDILGAGVTQEEIQKAIHPWIAPVEPR